VYVVRVGIGDFIYITCYYSIMLVNPAITIRSWNSAIFWLPGEIQLNATSKELAATILLLELAKWW